jgi:glycosyltransferase involved in cell wall biosynthesis
MYRKGQMNSAKHIEKVLIICPVYKERYNLSRLIDSIQNQSWSKWELLIVDNASLDGTRELVFEKYINDKRIKFFENKISLPSNLNWNEAANIAFELDYDSVCWVAGDDFWGDDSYLESLVYSLAGNVDIAMPNIVYQFADFSRYFYPKFSKTKQLNHVRLASDWRYVMVLYGLYTRTSFDKVFDAQNHFFRGGMVASLDWWWTYSAMNFRIVNAQEAKYVKTSKNHNDVDLYLDPTLASRNRLERKRFDSDLKLIKRSKFLLNFLFIEIYKLAKLQYSYIKLGESLWVNFLMSLMFLSRFKFISIQFIRNKFSHSQI